MRKVLLASTALVAFGTVAANAADVTLTGATNWEYISYDNASDTAGTNGTYFDHDFDMDVAFTETLDNGLTTKMAFGVSESGVDDGYFSIAGDFGTIKMIHSSGGIMGGAIAETVVDDKTTLGTDSGSGATVGLASKHDEAGGESTATGIQYTLPAMGGFTLAAEMRDSGVANKSNYSAAMATYTADMGDGGSVKLNYGSASTDDTGVTGNLSGTDATSLGVTVAMSDFAVSASRHTLADNGNTTDYATDILNVQYSGIDGIVIDAFQKSGDDDINSTYDFASTAASVTYTIATGLSASVTMTDSEVTSATGVKADDDATILKLSASF